MQCSSSAADSPLACEGMFSFVGQSPVSPSPTQGWSEPCLPASPVPPHAIQADHPLPCPSVPAEHPVSLPVRPNQPLTLGCAKSRRSDQQRHRSIATPSLPTHSEQNTSTRSGSIVDPSVTTVAGGFRIANSEGWPLHRDNGNYFVANTSGGSIARMSTSGPPRL